MELGRSGDRADVDFAWRSGGPATAGRGEVGGVRRSIDKFRGTDTAPELTFCSLVPRARG